MQIYRLYCNGETDWIAANSEAEARKVYMNHYDVTETDMQDVRVAEEKTPDRIEVYTDDHDYEVDDPEMPTLAEMVEGKTAPFLVASTCQ